MNRKKTQVIQIDNNNPQEDRLKHAADIVKAGGLVAFPTETVYGLAALPTDDLALEKLRVIKKRQEEKKFSLCVSAVEQIEERVEQISPFVYKLIEEFWPGPLTLVLESDNGQTTGFRMPDHKVAQMFLTKIGSPVFAPSANFAGDEPPKTAEEVLKYFDGKIDAVIDSGRSEIGLSSTVVQINEGYQVLRQGVITKEMIENIFKRKNILFVCTGNSCRSAMAEGIMKKLCESDPNIHVESAGVAAFNGMRASAEAIEVMKSYGIDISGHRARRLTNQMVKVSDYILVMDNSHRNFMFDRYWRAKKKVFLLKEFSSSINSNLAIHDPIGQGIEFYEQVANIIADSIKGLKEKLK
jgi:L-threonylcarbamoyladenylate synthase